MMPRPNPETMEGGYSSHSYGRPPQQGGPSQRGGGGGGGGSSNPQHNTNLMGMPPQSYDPDMRSARYGMGPPNIQHHHGMGPPNMDPSGMGMSGYHRGHDAMGGAGPSPGGPGGMMSGPPQGQHLGSFSGYPQDMSPTMPRMTTGNMYGMQQQQPPQPQQPQQGNSPSYPNAGRETTGMGEMGSNSEGRASAGGASGMPGGSSGPSGGGGGPPGAGSGSLSQAEREEELLLNLLIARRQRGRMSGEPGPGGRPEGLYADELLRLRQQGRAAAAGQVNMPHGQSSASSRGAGGGTLPPMPGMPPLYMDHPVNTLPAVSGHHMNVGIAGNTYNDHHHRFGSSDVVAMNLPIQEGVDQRIDRSPPHLMDARSQDMMMMRDFSGRGMKRSPYEMAPPGVPTMHGHHAGPGMPIKYQMQLQGLDMSASGSQPNKKKRSHKKKPADMPRRPLSAYNLFFSEERERILKEIDGKGEEGDDKKEEETKEEVRSSAASEGGDDSAKPKALLRPLIPNQKKRRPHRKTHGKISFQQLARMVGERWKALPDDRRKYYQELAQEDMKRQKQAMEEYYAKQQAMKEGRKPHEMAQAQDPGMYVKQQQQQSMETQVTGGIPEHPQNM